ncbi:hypothetical protein MSKU9_2764 [Komagataeibacter diospyri]|uniref:Uncharacterized protein n=1 Tax=Komagataeibacter diospyri TaxID=1932662 RepID=A0A4P5NST8_9PROT|nr:hypothetical protein MSKU9_2764 [Komagataeibacter diospyri]
MSDPFLYDRQDIGLLFRIQWLARRHGVPFGNTAPAAGAGGMLGNEDRVSPPRGLPAVPVRVGGGESGGDEIRRVRHDFR